MLENSVWDLNITKFERAAQPAHSPDISPCDLWLFGFLKEKFKEQELATSSEIIEAIATMWNDATFEELQSLFSQWIQHVTWVIEHGGSITMNDCDSFLKEFSLVEKVRAVRTFWTAYNKQ
jgi:hypothetical protein